MHLVTNGVHFLSTKVFQFSSYPQIKTCQSCCAQQFCADFAFPLTKWLLSFCRTTHIELVAGWSLYAPMKKKTSKESRYRLVIQMTLYSAFLFLFPFPPLPLVALSQSSFLSFYSTFPLLTSSVSLHTNGKRELRVTCAGSCFFASA